MHWCALLFILLQTAQSQSSDARCLATECELEWIRDGVCDYECLNEECYFDGGDCRDKTCGDLCLLTWIGDGECDRVCNSRDCRYDGGDCEILSFLQT